MYAQIRMSIRFTLELLKVVAKVFIVYLLHFEKSFSLFFILLSLPTISVETLYLQASSDSLEQSSCTGIYIHSLVWQIFTLLLLTASIIRLNQ